MKSSLVEMTPAWAFKLLDAHERLEQKAGQRLNRGLRQKLVDKYAEDMKRGLWVTNGATISVGANGRIIDGQHRLWACHASGVSFQVLLVEGLGDDAFAVTDIGAARTAGDILGVAGVVQAHVVAGAARWIIAYRNKTLSLRHHLSTARIREFVLSNPTLSESAKAGGRTRNLLAPSISTAWHFLFAGVDIDAATYFIDRLASGTELRAGEPIHVFRQFLIKNRSSSSRFPPDEVFVRGINAWRAFRDRRSVSRFTGKKVVAREDGGRKILLPELDDDE